MTFSQLADGLFTVENFYTRPECLASIVQSEGIGYELAKVSTAGGSRVRQEVCNNSRAFYRNPELAETR